MKNALLDKSGKMSRVSCIVAASLLVVSATLSAEPTLLTEARLAFGDGVSEIAIHKLEKLLDAKELSAADRAAATLLLGQALFDEKEDDDALTTIQPLAASGEPAAIQLRANILIRQGRWAEALPLYQRISDRSDSSAKIAEAECLRALDRTTEAVAVLEPLARAGVGGVAVRLRLAALYIDAGQLGKTRDLLASTAAAIPEERLWKKYVEARLLLARNQPAPAETLFEEMLGNRETLGSGREHLPESLLFAATYGESEAVASRMGNVEAHKVMERFIWQFPDSAYLEEAFRRLDEIYASESDPPESELHHWARPDSPGERRAALALYYVAKMQIRDGNWDKAVVSLDVFLHKEAVRSHLPPAYAVRGYLMQAEISDVGNAGGTKSKATNLDAAKRLAGGDSDLRGEIEFRDGLVQYERGEQVIAAQLFESAGKLSPRLHPAATFNAALAWLNQEHFDKFREACRQMTAQTGGEDAAGELLLEEGLTHARNGDPQAESVLKTFLRDHPGHRREGEAHLALAELSFAAAQSGARASGYAEAAEYLQVANTVPLSPDVAAHSDYLAVFMTDSQPQRDDEKVISLARAFVSKYSQSPLLPEVLMKLGEVYFRREDFANAETQFAALAKEQSSHKPPGPYAETALFLAGRSATGLGALSPGAIDRALGYFEQVARGNGPLKLYARQEEASIKQSTGHETEAINLYDVILSSDPDPELRQAALCGKGNNLRMLGKKGDREQLEAAVKVFDQLANLADVTPEWRNQALYNKARTLELLHGPDAGEVLDTFYAVLEKTASHQDREYFWYYKAGFDAAHIFEDSAEWGQAIGVYRKMVKFGGPRAAEAEARIKLLQLEHFIWE